MNNSKGKLYLIPSMLGENAQHTILPMTLEIVNEMDFFIVESAKSARRFLRSIGYTKSFDEMEFIELNEHNKDFDSAYFLNAILKGKNAGLISDAGIPCVADPGNIVVRYAHQNNVDVIPLVGPSSIMLALMASGLNGQQFFFHGYIPVKEPERSKCIKSLDVKAHEGVTQIFIETPYRNNRLIQELVQHCRGETLLTIACDLTLKTESIRTKKIDEWKKKIPELNKRPAVFLLGV